jgi:hypothetical protein
MVSGSALDGHDEPPLDGWHSRLCSASAKEVALALAEPLHGQQVPAKIS